MMYGQEGDDFLSGGPGNDFFDGGPGSNTFLDEEVTAPSQYLSTPEETPLPVTIGAYRSDNAPLTYTIVTPPQHGTLTGTAPNLVFIPFQQFVGLDRFVVRASYGPDYSLLIIWIWVTAVPDPAPKIDLDVDANRDGAIDRIEGDDEYEEDNWTTGPTGRGAIVLLNSDKDNSIGIGPDNLVEMDWDLDGNPDSPNRRVDDNGDVLDLAPLWIHKTGLPDFPDGAKLVLEVVTPAGDALYFMGTPPQERVRIFWPGDDQIITAGDWEVIGPGSTSGGVPAVARVEFVKNPTGSQKDNAPFLGTGVVQLAVEGLDRGVGSIVEIKLSYYVNDVPQGDDKVQMKVAPFILADHRLPVQSVGSTVFVANNGPSNVNLRDTLKSVFGNTRVMETVKPPDPPPPLPPAILDLWHQDAYEIGYSKSPYREMPVVLELARAKVFDPLNSDYDQLQKFIRTQMLKKDVAVLTIIKDEFGGGTFDSGGNIEAVPVPGRPGKFFRGKDMDNDIEHFFEAQGVNHGFANPGLDVNTDWLAVGHVDEVVSFGSDGQHVVVADPELAWGLMLLAFKKNPGARMNLGMTVAGVSTERAVGDALNDVALRSFNFEIVMQGGNLPSIVNAVAPGSPVSTPAPANHNSGGATLAKAGAFSAFLPASGRQYEIVVTSVLGGRFEYSVKQSGTVNELGRAFTDEDAVFDEDVFILKHWWGGGAPAVGDAFTFSVTPQTKRVPMPVLFAPDPLTGTVAIAFSTNAVNAIVHKDTVIYGHAYGPHAVLRVKATPGWPDGQYLDVFETYFKDAFKQAGYTILKSVNQRDYHDGEGGVHCGVNVIRKIPAGKWWE